MYICGICQREFKNQQALASHQRWCSRGDKRSNPEKSISAADRHCPNCGYEQPGSDLWGKYGYTVCVKCLCMFEETSKQIYSLHHWQQ